MAVNRDLKRSYELGLPLPTVHTVTGKKRALEGNAPIFDSKTKEAREAKHGDLGAEVYS